MATIINTPPGNTTETSGSSAGWAVAVIILIAVVAVGAYLWVNYYGMPGSAAAVTPAASGNTNINVTIPGATGSTTTTH